MLYGTRVKLVLAESPDTALPGVKLALFDRDEGDPDDILVSGVTGEDGEVFLSYRSEQFTDLEDQPVWHTKSLPELYVVVYDVLGQVVHSTRKSAQPDQSHYSITVDIPRDLAIKYYLI